MRYQDFAEVYDLLMDDVDYEAWARFYLDCARCLGMQASSWLDAACGTGNLTLPIARSVPAIYGADLSAPMLARAEQKARQAKLKIHFLNQDMRALSLHRPVDVITCGCDGVNYLTGLDDVRAFFHAAHRCLIPGGLLLFDVSTDSKLMALDNITVAEDREETSFIWQNRFDHTERLLRMDLTLFIRQGALYRRCVETHLQRAHTVKELTGLLTDAGFTLTGLFGSTGFDALQCDDERAYFCARST